MARVLAVDDEAAILTAAARVLERGGHEVAVAGSGVGALEMAERELYDVALVDFQMPELNGLSVLQHLLVRQPSCMRVLMSGQLDLPLAIDAVNKGATCRLLRKPFSPEILLTTVDKCMDARSRLDELLTSAALEAEREQRRMLDECLGSNAIQLAVQPIVAARDGQFVACEALLRSAHPVLDNPAAVLRAAERCGMVDEVACVVAQKAEEWLERLPEDTKLFVNLHPEELGQPDDLRNRLAGLERLSERVVLEITERSSLLDVPAWEASIRTLVEMGFQIAVDDLGAGYSSLSVLAALEPDYMKVDMSIIRDIDGHAHKQRLLELLCRFADASNALLIAEGVETRDEARTVRECGAHLLQGYWIGRPWLPTRSTARVEATRTHLWAKRTHAAYARGLNVE